MHHAQERAQAVYGKSKQERGTGWRTSRAWRGDSGNRVCAVCVRVGERKKRKKEHEKET